MVLYLLPWSRKKSRMDLIKKDLSEVWKEGGNRFPELNPLREALIRHFGVKTSPLAPAFRRYKGKFWEELSFWALPSRVQEEIAQRGILFSPLLGMLSPQDPVPIYDLNWKTPYEGKTLRDFWKVHLEGIQSKLFKDAIFFDFLTSEDRKVFSPPKGTQRIIFEYYRRDRRVINSLPHRAYTLRYIVEMKVGIENLERINFLDYRVKGIAKEGNTLKVILQSEGKYI